MALQTNAATPAVILGGMSCLLMALSFPQMNAAWLTAPAALDHTHPVVVDAAQHENYTAALRILPQAQPLYDLSASMLRQPNLTTEQRETAVGMLQQAATRTPGNTHVWYLLAAALEPEMLNDNRRAMWDHAMSMSLLTGPFARDLALPRAVQMTQHWDIASPELKNLWQEQMIKFWGSDPDEMHALYMALPPGGQKIIFDTLGEVPEAETNN